MDLHEEGVLHWESWLGIWGSDWKLTIGFAEFKLYMHFSALTEASFFPSFLLYPWREASVT